MAQKVTPQTVVRAHQFLYYQGMAVWSDYRYDQFCKLHKIDGKGGSDRAEDYSIQERNLAEAFERNPELTPELAF